MFCKITCMVLANFIVTSQSNRLDPSVFRTLGSMELPNVGNGFQMEFFFNTYDNVLLNAHADNATYSVHILPEGESPSIINLFIPMEEVNLHGMFQSEFEIVIPSRARERRKRSVVLVNQGYYNATMERVYLAFAVHVARVRREVVLYLHHCYPVMEKIKVTLVPESQPSKHPKLQEDLLRELMDLVSKEEYGNMFCRAMQRVLNAQDSGVVKAIMSRLKQMQYPKSA